MKAVVDQPGVHGKPKKRNGNARPRRMIAVAQGSPRQRARNQWIHRLEAAHQAAVDLGMQPLRSADISSELRSRRNELP
jgi:hypothetical protein